MAHHGYDALLRGSFELGVAINIRYAGEAGLLTLVDFPVQGRITVVLHQNL